MLSMKWKPLPSRDQRPISVEIIFERLQTFLSTAAPRNLNIPIFFQFPENDDLISFDTCEIRHRISESQIE